MIVHAWPPNIEAIVAVLPATANNIFAYDWHIYNPSKRTLGPELIAHERVHFHQQGQDSEGWWERFLADPEFRLSQELPAHIAEYREYCKRCHDRNQRYRFLHHLAQRLSSPMYGGLITKRDALKQIRS